MPVHAFVDESSRSCRYLLASAVVMPSDLSAIRTCLRGMLLPGAREIHFRKERDVRRRAVADVVARLPIRSTIYSCESERAGEAARQACLARLTEDLLTADAHRVVLDSRNTRDGNDQDRYDRDTIRRVLGKRPSETLLVYEHMASTSEELLWLPDVVAWCWGSGGRWRKRIENIVDAEVLVVSKGQLRARTARNPASDRPDGRPGPLHPPTRGAPSQYDSERGPLSSEAYQRLLFG